MKNTSTNSQADLMQPIGAQIPDPWNVSLMYMLQGNVCNQGFHIIPEIF